MSIDSALSAVTRVFRGSKELTMSRGVRGRRDAQEGRSGTDRRSGEDRRKENGGLWNAFTPRFHERRIEKDRRSRQDRRVG